MVPMFRLPAKHVVIDAKPIETKGYLYSQLLLLRASMILQSSFIPQFSIKVKF